MNTVSIVVFRGYLSLLNLCLLIKHFRGGLGKLFPLTWYDIQ